MRLAAAALVVLLLPTLAATPLVDEGPVAFTYEAVGVDARAVAMDVSVATHGSKLGLLWTKIDVAADAVFTEMLVRDGLVEHRLSVPYANSGGVVFDSRGHLHAAWGKREAELVERLMISTFDGQAWTTQTLGAVPLLGWPSAFESGGSAFVFFPVNEVDTRSPNLSKFYRLNESLGTWELVTTRPGRPDYPRLAGDAQGRIHVVHHDFGAADATQARYSVYDAGSWTTSLAPFPPGFVTQYDIAVGPDGRPHFVWTDHPNLRVHYVRPTAQGTYEDIVVSQPGIGMAPRLTIDPAGTPHIITSPRFIGSDFPTSNQAYYHTQDEAGWSTQVLTTGMRHAGADISLDSEGYHLAALPARRTETVTTTPASTAWGGIILARPAARLAPDAPLAGLAAGP